MKRYLYTLFVALILAASNLGDASAKRVVVPKMYMFGFAASFNDTIVYFTDIQEVDSAWIEKKSKFLQNRDLYASQLRDFLAKKKQMPHRTCIVFYNKKRAKLEKKFVKMRRLYSKGKDGREHFDMRQLEAGEFRFKPLDLTGLDEQEAAQALEDEKATKEAQKDAKAKKKADKKNKKSKKRGK